MPLKPTLPACFCLVKFIAALVLQARRVCLEMFPLQGTNAVQKMEGSLKIE
jgi:hypothetical protein